MVFGSKLYGTDNENSDTDYKGVFLPSKNECFLNNYKKVVTKSSGGPGKNNANDVDEELYSLQYFMHLAYKGEMIVLDMLHAPEDKMATNTPIWRSLREKRSMFYSKNMHGYLGYIRKQVSRYSAKGDRLNAMKSVLDYLKGFDGTLKLNIKGIWEGLPVGQYCFKVELPQEERWELYEVAGKRFPETITVANAKEMVQRNYDKSGNRAKKAQLNNGIDWKAVSHAFRAVFQLQELLDTNDLVYPLKEAQYLKDVKEGKLDYKKDKVGERLEQELDLVECKILVSDWPEKVNKDLLDAFIIDVYSKEN